MHIRKERERGFTTTNKHGVNFTDLDVALFVKKHLRLKDRFNLVNVVLATLMAFDIFLDEAKIVSENENWKFFDQETKFEWIEDPE